MLCKFKFGYVVIIWGQVGATGWSKKIMGIKTEKKLRIIAVEQQGQSDSGERRGPSAFCFPVVEDKLYISKDFVYIFLC